MDREWHKPALLIYRDGRIWPTNRVFEQSYVEVAEFSPPGWVAKTYLSQEVPGVLEPHKRYFSYRCEGGPYAVYVEV